MRAILSAMALLAAMAPLQVWADSLHQAIDAQILAVAKKQPLAPPCTDEAFVRRVYLDLIGRIPSLAEAKAFLDDKAANKRTLLVDKLLASPEHPKRLRDLFHAMLMERRGENAEWEKFLDGSFAANKPWDQLVREILDPDSENEATRGAAYFHTRRLEKVGQQETDYPGLTRDVGRLFLGVDLQCAQCHNHLFIDSYKQRDFQGLFTVYTNAFIRTDTKFPAIGQKLMSAKIEFMSVFEKIPLTTGPRVPFGTEVEIPVLAKGEEYLEPPDRKRNFLGKPKFNPMKAIAENVASSDNASFVANFVNRVWFVLMGRGLVMPLDQQHEANRPSHPELLTRLATEATGHKFDIKALMREIVLSDAYQRSSVLSGLTEPPAPESYRVANEKRLSAEQLLQSVLVATGPIEYPGLAVAGNDKLKAAFVKAFANSPAEPEVEFAPSLKSALFVLNDAQVLALLEPKDGHLVSRLIALDDPAAIANEMYLSILTRRPTEEERQAVASFLADRKERRPAALTNMVWALLASTEFCLNH